MENKKISCLAELFRIGVGDIAAGASHAAVRQEAIFCIAKRCVLIVGIRRAQAVINFNWGSLENH